MLITRFVLVFSDRELNNSQPKPTKLEFEATFRGERRKVVITYETLLSRDEKKSLIKS